MKAMFPSNQSSGLSASGRALLIAGGAIAVAAALVLYRGEVRAEARTLLGQLQDVPVIGEYVPHQNRMPMLHHVMPVAAKPGATPGGKPGALAAAKPGTKPGVAVAAPPANAQHKPGAAAVPAAKPGAGAAAVASSAASASPVMPATTPVAVQAGRPAGAPATGKPVVPAPHVTVAGVAAAAAKSTASPSGAVAARAAAKDSAVDKPIMREVFTYDQEARRDPFYSLMKSGDLRPGIADLNLMGILYDESGRRPVAIMRDKITNAQYRVTNGQQLGRMRVAQIRRKMVLFTIEEFGMNRMDSLVLGDSTKARAR